MATKKSELEYRNDFLKIHGDKYLYEKFPNKFNQKTKIKVICKKHNFEFLMTLNNLMNGHGCPKCGKENMVVSKHLLNQERHYQTIINNFPDLYELHENEFKNNKFEGYVWTKCKKCGFETQKRISEIVRGCGCSNCRKDNMKESYYIPLRESFNKKIRDFGKKVFLDRYSYEKVNYINRETPVIIHCNYHNYDFKVRPGKFFDNLSGCPICAAEEQMSSFERATKYLLDDNNIKFIPQFTIKDDEYLKNKPYDFLILETNIIFEIDGDQHRKPAFGKTIKDLENQKEIDAKKVEYAKKYGYTVYRLPTNTDFLEKIKDILNLNKSSTTIRDGVESSDSK